MLSEGLFFPYTFLWLTLSGGMYVGKKERKARAHGQALSRVIVDLRENLHATSSNEYLAKPQKIIKTIIKTWLVSSSSYLIPEKSNEGQRSFLL